MWCDNCHAEVAAEVSGDNTHVRCATCGTVIATSKTDAEHTEPLDEKTRNARQLLQRWSSDTLLDPYGPPVKLKAAADSLTPPALPSSPTCRTSTDSSPKPAEPPSLVPISSEAEPPTESRQPSDSADSHQLPTVPAGADSVRASEPAIAPSRVPHAPQTEPEAPLTPRTSRIVAPLSSIDSFSPLGSPSTTAQERHPNETSTASPSTPSGSERPVTPLPPAGPADSPDTLPASADGASSSPAEQGPSHAAEPLRTTPSDSSVTAATSSHAPTGTTPASSPAASRSVTAAVPPEKTRLEKTPPDRDVPESRRFETPRARSIASATSPTAESSAGLHDAPPQTRLDADHRLAQPHIDVRASIEESQDGRSNMWTGIGQLLAYAGVLGLTLGSCLVLWSYFGGPARYAPTGWLITTASQMLLFLGVITLISGGLEQTTRILTRRIDRLGERLLRFEQASPAPVGHGPRISPAAYQGADQATEFHRSDDNARAAASNQHA